jgi:putative NADH-flavin reductase
MCSSGCLPPMRQLNWSGPASALRGPSSQVNAREIRLGKDDLIVDAQGQSRISAEDYAMALVDELETPQNVRQRFTVGY